MEIEDYDYSNEVANSAYADMLHDDERNQLYFDAIREAVATLRSRGNGVRVLDIGTGTGLLSMMAAQCGADYIIACEAFKPMASCAEKILARNGFSSKVRVVHKRSTELVVGEDLPERANLLVAELFDTELIGEGAIGTYDHARRHLLTEDALLVPSGARIFAQVVSSEFLVSCNVPYRRKPACSTEFRLPTWLAACPGSTSLHDLQLSQLPPDLFTAVSEPLCVFSFDWSGRDIPLALSDTAHVDFVPNRQDAKQVECHAVLMWWHLIMDQKGDIVLSCAPHWAESNSSYAWRDHWMQAIYYLPSPFITLPETDKLCTLTLNASRDDYSMWFTLSQGEKRVRPAAPHCTCGQHIVNPRTRLLQLSDAERLDEVSSVVLNRAVQSLEVTFLMFHSRKRATIFLQAAELPVVRLSYTSHPDRVPVTEESTLLDFIRQSWWRNQTNRDGFTDNHVGNSLSKWTHNDFSLGLMEAARDLDRICQLVSRSRQELADGRVEKRGQVKRRWGMGAFHRTSQVQHPAVFTRSNAIHQLIECSRWDCVCPTIGNLSLVALVPTQGGR
ncbi:S-adenosyl-L-methionine-dependent methyltransferase [Trinorchestia longiramus]|nr:S-adenosyl-L-methionine-dependent methyltransferase [Trinorchestia longiramus]